MNLKSIKGIFTISGTIVGAGILALPLAMAQLGFVPGFFVLAVVGLAFIYTAYYIGEAAINSEEEISLSGLAKKHFGAIGLGVMLFGVLVYIYGALIGYLSAGGKVINDLSNGLISQSWGTVIYFIFGAFIVYMGLRFVESSEFVLFGLVLLLFRLILELLIHWHKVWQNFHKPTALHPSKVPTQFDFLPREVWWQCPAWLYCSIRDRY